MVTSTNSHILKMKLYGLIADIYWIISSVSTLHSLLFKNGATTRSILCLINHLSSNQTTVSPDSRQNRRGHVVVGGSARASSRGARQCAPYSPRSALINGRVVIYEMSSLLKTGLDRESLSLCSQLLDQGVNPEALAAVIKELRSEAAALKRT